MDACIVGDTNRQLSEEEGLYHGVWAAHHTGRWSVKAGGRGKVDT